MLHRECGTPIKQKRWCPVHDREVAPDEIVKGWEVSKGQFVLVEDADLEALERTDDSRSIEITQFVRLEEVDPIYFDRTYFLVPGQAPAQRRPYALLLEAMNETGVAALGTLRALGPRVALPRPRARRRARARDALPRRGRLLAGGDRRGASRTIDVKEPELELARQVIESLEAPFDATALVERVPPRPARAARGEAARRGDRGAGAGRRRMRRSST